MNGEVWLGMVRSPRGHSRWMIQINSGRGLHALFLRWRQSVCSLMNEQGEIVYQWYGLHSDFNAGAWIEWWEKRVFAYSHCTGAYFCLIPNHPNCWPGYGSELRKSVWLNQPLLCFELEFFFFFCFELDLFPPPISALKMSFNWGTMDHISSCMWFSIMIRIVWWVIIMEQSHLPESRDTVLSCFSGWFNLM